MSLQDKVLKLALNNAMDSINDNMPQLELMLKNYKEWNHKDLLAIYEFIDNFAELLEGANLPIKPETIKALGRVYLINADQDNEKYQKVKKLFISLNKAINQYGN
jgi:hypothetical protein|uniref:AMDV5_2 n=1 Tax=uncultured virus TaxID=340016 RepID=B3GAN4_9VIRU|nr:AMDV5_2 [uncultured virus]